MRTIIKIILGVAAFIVFVVGIIIWMIHVLYPAKTTEALEKTMQAPPATLLEKIEKPTLDTAQ